MNGGIRVVITEWLSVPALFIFLLFYIFVFLPVGATAQPAGSVAITKQTLKNTVVMTNLHNKSAKVRAI